MSDLEWFPLYVNRFLNSRRLRRMAAEYIGIYTLLLCESWEGGPLPDDDESLAFLGRCNASDARAVLEQCFSLGEEGWTNPELEQIRAEQTEKRDRLVEAGRKGGQARAANRSSDAKAMLKQPSSNRVEEKRIEKKKPKAPAGAGRKVGDYDESFSLFWTAYPRGKNESKKGTHRQWLARLNAGAKPEEMIAGAERYAAYIKATDRYAKAATTFLGPDDHWKLPWVATEALTTAEPEAPYLDPKFKKPFKPDLHERPKKEGLEKVGRMAAEMLERAQKQRGAEQ